MEIPEWIAKAIDDCLGQAVDAVVDANTMESLWAAKGRLAGIKEVKQEIELSKAHIDAEEGKFVEGLVSHA
jgi:hypothetical protein